MLCTSLDNCRTHEEYDCYYRQSDYDPLVHGIRFLWHEIFNVLFCTSAFASAHVMSPLIFYTEKLLFVSRNAFTPKPNVDSEVIALRKKSNIRKADNEELFFKLVRDSFKFKRKNIRNNLKSYDLTIVEEVL